MIVLEKVPKIDAGKVTSFRCLSNGSDNWQSML